MEIKENKMGTMPVGKLLFTMAVPLVASMLFQALYNIVDSVFVARLGQDAMNAVSLAFPMQTLTTAFALGTGVGMNALLSRSLGAGQPERANQAANTGLCLYAITALVFMTLGITLSRAFYHALTDNPQIISYGSAYVSICIGCCFAFYGQICSEQMLSATGRTDLAMIPQITGAVLNMILDPILIFGLLGLPRLEVVGAAVATVIGQFVAAIVGFTLNLRLNHEIHLSFKLMRLHKNTVADIYRVAVPTIIMQSIGSVMTFGMNRILIGFTEAATAVFGAYFKLQSFIFMPVFGMNNALIPILSFNLGARKFDRLKHALKLGMITAVCIMTFGTILFETIPGVLLSLFSPSEEMLQVGRVALRVIGAHFPVGGFCILAGAACQALRRPVYGMINSVTRQIVVLLPAAYLLSLTGRLELVWFAFLIAEISSFTLSVIFLRKTLRETLADDPAAAIG